MGSAKRNCAVCRFWSEMIAKAEPGKGVEAKCLNPASRQHLTYTEGFRDCMQWEDGSLGAVDQPGGNPYST